MRYFPLRIPATFAAVLVALSQFSCAKSIVGPIPQPAEKLILDSSFERDGLPTFEGWRIANPSVTTLVREPAPGGGEWSLGLEADWAPTTGVVTRPILGVRDGDVLRLSAFVRAVDVEGGGAIGLSIGPSYGLRTNRAKWASTDGTAWTLLSVQDTVSLGPADTVWVALTSGGAEVAPRSQGRFDLVVLSRIRNTGVVEIE